MCMHKKQKNEYNVSNSYLNQLEKVLDAFENLFIKKEKRN